MSFLFQLKMKSQIFDKRNRRFIILEQWNYLMNSQFVIHWTHKPIMNFHKFYNQAIWFQKIVLTVETYTSKLKNYLVFGKKTDKQRRLVKSCFNGMGHPIGQIFTFVVSKLVVGSNEQDISKSNITHNCIALLWLKCNKNFSSLWIWASFFLLFPLWTLDSIGFT